MRLLLAVLMMSSLTMMAQERNVIKFKLEQSSVMDNRDGTFGRLMEFNGEMTFYADRNKIVITKGTIYNLEIGLYESSQEIDQDGDKYTRYKAIDSFGDHLEFEIGLRNYQDSDDQYTEIYLRYEDGLNVVFVGEEITEENVDK